jgi:membrane-associated protein
MPLREFIDFFLHLDVVLAGVIENYGGWTYALLFAVIFAETGLVITPILPGDSLLFAAGTFSGRGSLDLAGLFILLSIAAILGDTVNYWVGKHLGSWLTSRQGSRLIRQEHLERTHNFFQRYGAKTIVLARFVPIVRTFAPFVAGLGTMTYRTFLIYNVVGALLWVGLCLAAGHLFGGLPVVRDNFSLVILAIVIVSLLPAVFEFVRSRRSQQTP